MAVSQLTFVLGIFLLPAGLVVMLTSAQPMIAMIIGYLLADEPMTVLGLIGALVGACGVVLASAGTAGGGADPVGVAVLFFSNTLFGVAMALVKGLKITHAGERFLIWSSALAAVGALPFAIVLESFAIEWRASFPLALAYTTVIGSTVGLLLLTFALQRGGVFVASLVALISPAFGIAAAAIFLDEGVTWLQLFGGVVIAAGVTLALRRPGSPAARRAA
jgi:O-acetylserine/cysteine efflux transporter